VVGKSEAAIWQGIFLKAKALHSALHHSLYVILFDGSYSPDRPRGSA